MKKFWNTLPGAAKTIAVVAALAVIGYAIYRLTRKKDVETDTGSYLQDVVNPPVDTAKTTISDTEVKSMVVRLREAMEGVGTDEDAIFDVFAKLQNRDDLHLLVAKFGIIDGQDLRGWLASELSGNDLKTIKQRFTDLGVMW